MRRPFALSVSLALACLAAGCLDLEPGRSSGQIEGEVCGLQITDVVNTHGDAFAQVTVSSSDTHLIVQVDATMQDALLLDLYLDATTGAITAASGGFVNYFYFPHQVHFAGGPLPASHTFEIPLAEVGLSEGSCGGAINVALFAKVRFTDVIGGTSGWAQGPGDCPQNHADTCSWLSFELCECPPPPPPPPPPPQDDHGCTRTQGYWKTHNEHARPRPLRVDWPAPHDEDDLLCGRTLLSILTTPPGGDAWLIVAHQAIAAALNVAAGASTTEGVDAALAGAEQFLLATCDGVPASEAGEALALKDILDAYNSGDIGPGHCD
ncbi:MAG TPA: hypothetical protein VKZ63_03695 [Kofleriaceae bacterium]|nr:hypothetical protein [Kofleriaceae bacterium]